MKSKAEALRWGRFFDGLMAARLFRHLERGIYEMIVSRCFILPPEQGEVRHSRIGGERSEPITRVIIMPYDTESQSRNALVSP